MYVNTLSDYLKEQFGEKIYKLSLNANMTCPNRDGKIGYGGCIFCSEGGSGEFCADKNLSITQQIEQAKDKVAKKINNGRYIAYFQSFTNTYAHVDYLEKIFTEAIEDESIVALSIATRPDCLPDDILRMLKKLNKIKPVWIELGLQTIHKRTADLINRGYELDVFETAVKNLKKIGVQIVVHIIIGLPFETKRQILQTVSYVGRLGADGIKLQLLHVLKNTELEKMYQNGEFQVLSEEEYIDILFECIKVLPKEVVIHRMTGDGDKRLLIAPLWSANKREVLNRINRELKLRNIEQGSVTI